MTALSTSNHLFFKIFNRSFCTNNNPFHNIVINQLLNANNLYYNQFSNYKITEHLSVLRGIFSNLFKCNNDFINFTISNDKYINHIINSVVNINDFDSSFELVSLICSHKFPINESIFLDLFNKLLSNYSILSLTSCIYNNKLFELISNSIKYRILLINSGNNKIQLKDDYLLRSIYIKFNQIISTCLEHHLIYQLSINEIDGIVCNVLSSIHSLIKCGYDFDYKSFIKLFISDGCTFLSTHTLISMLYSLLGITNDYLYLYNEISMALNYKLFVMDKSQGDLLLQILSMHKIKQRSMQFNSDDTCVKLLSQIIRRRFELYMQFDTINNLVDPLYAISTLFGYNKIIKKLLLPKINKLSLKTLTTGQYCNLIHSLHKLNLSSSNKQLSINIYSTFTRHINNSKDMLETCNTIINVSKFLPKRKRKILLKGINVLENQLIDHAHGIDEVNLIFLTLDKIPAFNGFEPTIYNILNKIITFGSNNIDLNNVLSLFNCINILKIMSTCDVLDDKIFKIVCRRIVKKSRNGLSSNQINCILKAFAKHHKISGELLSIIINNLDENSEILDMKILINLTKLFKLIDEKSQEHIKQLISNYCDKIYSTNNKNDIVTLSSQLGNIGLENLKFKLLNPAV